MVLTYPDNKIILDAASYSYALRVYYCNYYSYAPTTAAPGLVSNNFISITAGTGTNYGLYAYYSNNVSIYHNSVHISDQAYSQPCLVPVQYCNSNTIGQTFIDNIFSWSSGGYAAYFGTTNLSGQHQIIMIFIPMAAYLAYWNGNMTQPCGLAVFQQYGCPFRGDDATLHLSHQIFTWRNTTLSGHRNTYNAPVPLILMAQQGIPLPRP